LIVAALLAAACGSPQPPAPAGSEASGTPDLGGGGASGAPDIAGRPPYHVPTGHLPAAAPLTTTRPDGERVDPIESLQALIESGDVVFSFDSVTGYLPSLLAALDIPVSSQGLVFSRTSLQATKIAPWVPRGLYFNDDVYIGYVVDSPILEVASIDPDDGAVFYTLGQDPDALPYFRPDRTCLGCHNKPVTGNVPGVMVRSAFVGRMGYTVTLLSEAPTVDRTPMEERFGGYYVSGTLTESVHAGNVRAPEESHELTRADLDRFDMNAGNDVTSLEGFDKSEYLSPHSDIVALLVLTHQTRLHNVITMAHAAFDEAYREQRAVLVTTGAEVPESGLLPATEVRIDSSIDQLVREMFFAHEAPLGGPVVGTSGFAEEFSSRGPTDRLGRSLRDFDLTDRIFRYPLSFLIYTNAFESLPDLVRRRVYARIDDVLSGRDGRDDFAHLDAATRTAIREILEDTKPDFAEATSR
jgi:hypothetical protein